MFDKTTLAKIKEMDRIAAEKIEAIQNDLKFELQKLGFVETVIGSYDTTQTVLCPTGQEKQLWEKDDKCNAQEDVDYIYTNALQN